MKKLILEELFLTQKDFMEVVSGTDTGDTFTNLNGSASSARKQISAILTSLLYMDIVAGNDEDLKDHLRIAMGNLTMAKDISFGVFRRRKAGVDLYKNEMEKMQRAYIDNYYNAMDSLIECLESDTEDKLNWQKTPYCKLRESLIIKSMDEFNLLYPIDSSYLFFFRTIPLQREILDDIMSDYFERTKEKEDMTTRLKRALAQLTVATAIRQFDIQELPATIRNLHDDSSAQRQASGEESRLLKLAGQLVSKATDTIKNIDLVLSDPESGNVETQTSFNEPDDKIYLMA